MNTRAPDAGMGILLALVVLGFAWMLDYTLDARPWTRWTEPAPASGPLEQLEPGDVDFAVHALQVNDVVRVITQGQPFRVGRTTVSRSGSKKTGVWIEILWDGPVVSDGPWTHVRCDGSGSVTGTQRVHDLLGLTALVSLSDGRLLALYPGAQQLQHTFPDGSLNWGYAADEDRLEHALPEPACPAN